MGLSSSVLSLLSDISEAQKTIVYHGTSSKFLPTIMQQGLLASGPSRANVATRIGSYWDSAPATVVPKGVYVATNIKQAFGAAKVTTERVGGEILLVIIEAQLSRSYPGEMNILRELDRAWGYRLGFTSGDTRKIVIDIKFTAYLSKLYTVLIHELVPPPFFFTWAQRVAKSLDIPYENIPLVPLRYYFQADIARRLNYVERWDDYSVQQTEEDYRKALYNLLKAMKSILIFHPEKRTAFWYPTDITFTSRNARIVAIMQMEQFDDGFGLQKVYGTVPAQVSDDITKIYQG